MAGNANFCTFDGTMNHRQTVCGLTHSNRRIVGVSSADVFSFLTNMAFTSGKWYWGFSCDIQGSTYPAMGITAGVYERKYDPVNNGVNSYAFRWKLGGSSLESKVNLTRDKWGTLTATATGISALSDGDIFQVALDVDNSKLWLGKNGTFFNSGNPAGGSNQQVAWTGTPEQIHIICNGYTSSSLIHMNAGQDDSFGGRKTSSSAAASDDNGFGVFYYTPPSGFLAPCTANLTVNAAIDPNETGEATCEKAFFQAKYVGNLSSRDINVPAQPDLMIIRQCNYAQNWYWFDTARDGPDNYGQKYWLSNSQSGEQATLPQSNIEHGNNSVIGISGGTWLNSTQSQLSIWGWQVSNGAAQDKTYAVTVVSDSGNKYRFDGHGTSAITIDVNEGSTITFDQSDNTNDGHPLRIYTAADKTGGEYTTGVTTTGTAGQAGAKTVITVPASAPTLYYQCSIHGAMGGQINTHPITDGISTTYTEGTNLSRCQVNQGFGMSICRYTGDGGSSNFTMGHGLGATPHFIIIKDMDANSNNKQSAAWHRGMSDDYYMYLSDSTGEASSGNGSVDTSALSSTVWGFNRTSSSGGAMTISQSGHDYISYLWTSIEGFSKFGSYIGNGNANGPKITTGFRPAFWFIKWIANGASSEQWNVRDTVRSPYNPTDTGGGVTGGYGGSSNLHEMEWDTNDAGAAGTSHGLNVLSDGFQPVDTGGAINASGGYYIYGAWADIPYKYGVPLGDLGVTSSNWNNQRY